MNNTCTTLGKTTKKAQKGWGTVFSPVSFPQCYTSNTEVIRTDSAIKASIYNEKTVYPRIHKDSNIFKYVYNN